MSKAAKGAISSVAVIAFAAATAFGSFALAQDGFGGPAADAAATARQDDSVTWDSQADGTVDKVPSQDSSNSSGTNADSSNTSNGAAQSNQSNHDDAAADATGNGAADAGAGQTSTGSDNVADNNVNVDPSDTTGDPAANAQVQQGQPSTVDVGVDCTAVADWTTLKTCMQQSGTVTISNSKAIDAGTNETIAIPDNVSVTLNAANGISPALTATATGNSLFSVGSGATLTIGDSLSYAGTEDAPAQRRLATVNAGGSIVFDGGTFEYIHTTDNGAVVLSNGGAVTVKGGTFAHNKAGNAADTGNGGFAYVSNGTVTVKGGTFDGNSAAVSGVIGAYGSTKVTIDDGTFKNNTATKTGPWNGGGVVRLADTASLDITGGTFTGNKASGEGGGVVYSMGSGTITISPADGQQVKFADNQTNGAGGAIYKINGGDLNVNGGSFENNKAYGVGGGAIAQDQGGNINIQPADGQTVTFKGNAQTFADDVLATCNTTTGEQDKCEGAGGGGAIYSASHLVDTNKGTGKWSSDNRIAKVNIQGNVLFDGNYSNRWGYSLGGGAVYASGELWVQNDARGIKPTFTNNYASVSDPRKDGSITAYRGGAGGAIFLMSGIVYKNETDENLKYTNKAYIMGGTFANNTSGYLGGAIYTESESVTYVAKAVAYANTAGHFGGGLWLCPSGTGTASKGGNIALFDNKVSNEIDPDKANGTRADGTEIANTNNQVVYAGKSQTYDGTGDGKGDGTVAGDDFAMMNPAWKGIAQTTFQLMDTWFTNRTETAVTWHQDGVPVREASGFQDYFQDPEIPITPGKWHNPDGGGTNLAVTKTGGRYDDGKTADVTIDMTNDGDDDDHLHTLKLTQGAGGITTGVALKAIVGGADATEAQREQLKANAKQAAAVTLTGNAARLSGGAFATNGDVKFSTPYTASWTKVETTATGLTNTEIAGAEWLLSTTDANGADKLGGPFSTDFYPKMCATDATGALTDAGKAAWNAGTCWKEEKTTSDDGTAVTTRSIIVTDNMGSDAYVGIDNNPDGGGFDINNLANGTYTLTERKAPTGYTPEVGTDGSTAKSYTFDVSNAQGIWRGAADGEQGSDQPGKDTDGNPLTNRKIGNKPLPGVSWSKIDTTMAEKDTVGGSVWTVTKVKDATGADIPEAQRISYTVTDCADPVTREGAAADAAAAADATPCKDGTNDDTAHTYADKDGTAGKFTIEPDSDGEYELVEKATPANYWQPAANTTYRFTIKAGDKDAKTVIYQSDGTTEVKDNAIANTPSQVAWAKVSAADPNGAKLAGSEWELYGPLDKDGNEVKDASGNTITFTGVITDCKNDANAQDPCSSHANTTTTDPTTGKVTHTYADIDPAEGQFRVRLMAVPTADNELYTYRLTEKKAPDGYILPTGVSYTFQIGNRQPTGSDGKAAEVTIDAASGVSKSLAVKHDVSGATNAIPNVTHISALPFTGGRAARDWAIVGGGLALVAGLVYAAVNWYRSRKGLEA